MIRSNLSNILSASLPPRNPYVRLFRKLHEATRTPLRVTKCNSPSFQVAMFSSPAAYQIQAPSCPDPLLCSQVIEIPMTLVRLSMYVSPYETTKVSDPQYIADLVRYRFETESLQNVPLMFGEVEESQLAISDHEVLVQQPIGSPYLHVNIEFRIGIMISRSTQQSMLRYVCIRCPRRLRCELSPNCDASTIYRALHNITRCDY